MTRAGSLTGAGSLRGDDSYLVVRPTPQRKFGFHPDDRYKQAGGDALRPTYGIDGLPRRPGL
jgi:hypothetical protein